MANRLDKGKQPQPGWPPKMMQEQMADDSVFDQDEPNGCTYVGKGHKIDSGWEVENRGGRGKAPSR